MSPSSLTAYLGIRKYVFKGVQDLLSLMVDALDASEISNFFFVCNHTKDNGQLLLLNILAMGKILQRVPKKMKRMNERRKAWRIKWRK